MPINDGVIDYLKDKGYWHIDAGMVAHLGRGKMKAVIITFQLLGLPLSSLNLICWWLALTPSPIGDLKCMFLGDMIDKSGNDMKPFFNFKSTSVMLESLGISKKDHFRAKTQKHRGLRASKFLNFVKFKGTGGKLTNFMYNVDTMLEILCDASSAGKFIKFFVIIIVVSNQDAN